LKLGRDTLLIAIGGGVVTDLGGFLAATYNRGIPLILIPTTLLGMVDAAIGGKTGVNTHFGKNLIGAYYPPQDIFIDPSLLSTLPEKEWINGASEIIKYALIHSPALFQQLANNMDKWDARDPIYLQGLINASIAIKQEVIEADFQESGYRRILNFGHTIAHAIETLEDYRISHGEAVALGMLIEGYLSYRLGLLSQDEFEEINALLRLFRFPLHLPPSITLEKLLQAMATDKKAKGAHPRFVLLNGIGSVAPFDGTYCSEVDEKLLAEGFQYGK
jgi:3-dehydroquinate synthase